MRGLLTGVVLAGALVGAGGSALGQIIEAPATVQPEVMPAERLRIYDRTQIIVKFRPEADPTAVMAAAMAGARESYRPDGRLAFSEQATGAAVVDLSGVLTEREQGRARFAVERVDRQEAGREEPIDALLSRLNADPRVEYAQKNYLELPDQSSSDLINSIIGGGADRPAAPQPNVAPGDRYADPAPVRPARVDATGTFAAPNDPYFVHQWHLKMRGEAISESTAPGAVNFPLAWSRHQPRRMVVVGVVDGGQVYEHQDVMGPAMLPGYDMIANPFVANDGDGRDPDPTDPGDGAAANACFDGSPERESSWHGSHVSGIAGAAASNNGMGIAGPLASGISVVPVRALGRCGGMTSDLADALMWAAGLDVPGVPRNRNPASVINASFGGVSDECRPAYRDALAQIRAAGALVVTTAGNDGFDASRKSPANCENALVVAASDIFGQLAPYSNFGENVDILAPGGNVSVDEDGNGFGDGILSIVADGYSFYQGTSMAAPVVTAALALALSHNPHWTVEDAVDRLMATAIPRSRSDCPDPCGAGLLDVSALID